jgi:hypothetical protein
MKTRGRAKSGTLTTVTETKLDPKAVVEDIRKRIEASRGTQIWGDYISALKLISQVVFTRSSGFILEFIQNAEDSGIGLSQDGVFEISISKHRVKIEHNGRPFNEGNVRALCGISPSKKPERGTLGYLGIGFKSVYKVTDSPEIYSQDYQFKFDRKYEVWADPRETPWQVLPIWLDKPSEQVDLKKTTFIIPLRETGYYEILLEELQGLRTELYLFLHWIKQIEVRDEESGKEWILEDLGPDKDGITRLKQGTEEQRFKLFRKEVQVNESVVPDRLTQEYRQGVKKREIAIAFAVDKDGNLSPTEAGAMYGGVYSFLPLGEASSGVKFPIQADFLVQPGRDAINYEAPWNRWILHEVAELCKEAIKEFKEHSKWKYQYLAAFEFSTGTGLESVERLFGPELVNPLRKFIEEDACVPAADESFVKPSQAFKIEEDPKAVEALAKFIPAGELGKAFVEDDSFKLVHASFVDRKDQPVKRVTRSDLLGNADYLSLQSKKPGEPDWFRNLYLWLNAHPVYDKRGRTIELRRYHGWKIVLTADDVLLRGGDVTFPDIPTADPFFQELAKTLMGTRKVIHPDILSKASDSAEQETLRGFLTGFTGVQLLNARGVCEEAVLPKILVKSPKPSEEDLLKYTRYCRDTLEGQIPQGTMIWVLSDDGAIRSAQEVLLPKVYSPKTDWETNRKYLSGPHFISHEYLKEDTTEERDSWRDFLHKAGVKQEPDNGVEDFAINYAKENLRLGELHQVEKRDFGYDLESSPDGGIINRVEAKGQSTDAEVELTGNETLAADAHRSSYYVCIVSGIPENPEVFLIRDPSEPGIGKKDKLTISISKWKSHRYFPPT